MNENLEFDRDGINLVELSEGVRLVAYHDAVGVLTIGYGHTGHDVYTGQTITQNEAEQLLLRDVRIAELDVKAAVKVSISQHQYDALVDFAFNLGGPALQGSTLLRLLNSGDYAGADAEFKKWDHAGGKVLPGLTKRRAAEATLFMAPGVKHG